MPVYFASDMHLRLDRPDRGERLAHWVGGLDGGDELYLVGDVCDFWFVARQRRGDALDCPGLRALAEFRQRGGSLTILPGNHDRWLGPFYQRALGAKFVEEPYTVRAFGRTVRLVHGHKVGGRPPWKAGMESRAFLQAFGALPAVVADRLDLVLDRSNDRHRQRDENTLIPLFRRYLAGQSGNADMVVFGHVHTPFDDPSTSPRMVILGGWHRRSSYLRLDERGALLVVNPPSK